MDDNNNPWGIASVKTKIIGKVLSGQMYLKEGKWILPRISPICEKCGSSDYYNVCRSSNLQIFYIPVIRNDVKYSIKCSSCRETIELDFNEYLVIEPLIKANRKYEKGKITRHEHEIEVKDILNKIEEKQI